jgi:magnesium transporter
VAQDDAASRASTESRDRPWLPLRSADWGRRRGVSASPHPTDPSEPLGELTDVIGDCAVYEDGHRRPGKVPLEQAGDIAHCTSGFVWVGLQQPKPEDIAVVAEEFGLPPTAVEGAVKAHQRPKLEVYGSVVLVVLKPLRYVDHVKGVDVAELAFFLGPSFLVTVRHGDSDVLHRVRGELNDSNSKLLEQGPTGVLCRTADLVVDGYGEAIDYFNSDVDAIESQVFGSDEPGDHAQRIYQLKREIAEFRRAVMPLATPLHQLAGGGVPGIDDAAAGHFRAVHDHVLRAADAIEGHDRLLSDVLQADLARVTARQSEIAVRQSQIAVRQNETAVRQNEDTRRISAWAAIGLVPTAIAGIYGMNFDNMPELRWRYGYFLVLGVIVGACVLLHRLFRRNGWL